MKVVFLDIDGVLNRNGTRERCGIYVGVDGILVRRFLDWMAKNPDIHIVLSSAWRMYPAPKFKHWKHLNDAGIHWIGITSRLHSRSEGEVWVSKVRGDEIQQYLDEHPEITNYAIIDDGADMLPSQLSHFVHTDADRGLTEADVEKLDAIFHEERT